MDVINSGDLEGGRSDLPYFLRVLALFFGYVLACTGWLIFFVCLFLIGMGFQELNHDAGDFFGFVGVLVTSGWLLLRFAGGLFPFSRRFFQWQKRKA
jgi:hypothetical protein